MGAGDDYVTTVDYVTIPCTQYTRICRKFPLCAKILCAKILSTPGNPGPVNIPTSGQMPVSRILLDIVQNNRSVTLLSSFNSSASKLSGAYLEGGRTGVRPPLNAAIIVVSTRVL